MSQHLAPITAYQSSVYSTTNTDTKPRSESQSAVSQLLISLAALVKEFATSQIGAAREPTKREYSPCGKEYSPCGKEYSPCGKQYSPCGKQYSPCGKEYSPCGKQYSPNGNIAGIQHRCLAPSTASTGFPVGMSLVTVRV